MMKRSSFSHKMRQSLSDITNSQSQEEVNFQETDLERSEQVNRLMKENRALIKLLEKRDKTIELSRYELRDLRAGIDKLQAQNWSLARTNSQFLAEINLARNKVKALNHEGTCKNALLKATYCEQQKEENSQPRYAPTVENVLKISDEELEKPLVPNRRRYIRSKYIWASIALKIEGEKEKSEIKRRQLRRKSAMVRSATQEVSENLFEIEDLQLTIPNNTCQQDNLTMASSHNRNKSEEGKNLQRRDILTRHQDCNVHRSPMDRLFLRAVEKIHSYKTIR